MSAELLELKKISKILIMANAKIIETELSKYATTGERKKVWVLIDGNRSVNDLIHDADLKQRTLYDFLKILESAELIEFPHGKPPKKTLDFVPASWLDLVTMEEVSTENPQPTTESTNLKAENSQGDLGEWVK